jgi:hypothetical protein
MAANSALVATKALAGRRFAAYQRRNPLPRRRCCLLANEQRITGAGAVMRACLKNKRAAAWFYQSADRHAHAPGSGAAGGWRGVKA